MGQILSQPVTEKQTEKGADEHLAYGISCMQGWRISMEDSHASILNLNEAKFVADFDETSADIEENNKNLFSENKIPEKHVSFFGVYDGHGGEKAAIFTGEHLHELVRTTLLYQEGDYVNALKQGFLSCDQAILKDYDMRDDESGCAATSVIITPKQVVCGNAGDSRTIMSINGFAKALSFDHKPSNEGEKTRICSAGGYVDMGRVNGNLALSRGIGDFEFKKNIDMPAEEQIVTCYPDVIQHPLNFAKDEFVVLACDGIWDCLSSQQCVECVRRGVFERKLLQVICEEIMELCCAPRSDGSGIGCDNMSITIVALLDESKEETLDQWYDKIIERVQISESAKEECVHYGPISKPYNEIYKVLYGDDYEIAQYGQNNAGQKNGSNYYSMINGLPGLRSNGLESAEEDQAEEPRHQRGDIEEEEDAGNFTDKGAISLQKLLARNAITNENGVIYLDTSSAQSLLAHFGMPGQNDDDIDDDVHDMHIEEEADDLSDDQGNLQGSSFKPDTKSYPSEI